MKQFSVKIFVAFCIKLISAYQRFLSPIVNLGEPRCRFYPSCSEYAKQCFEKYNLLIAVKMILWRLCRCQPWHPGGVDLP